MNVLYPPLAPFKSFHLKVTKGHSIYVEQSGNASGMPVIFLHGGPCSGTRPSHRQFFNPDFFHIILFDQRGCGQSKPFGKIQGNTTASLITDLEAIRQYLSIDTWVLFGGSWGAALALLYAQQYQQRVEALVLRGVFLARRQDMVWFIKAGANKIYPQLFEDLLAALPEHAVKERVERLYQAVVGADERAAIKVAKAWEAWGSQLALGVDYSADDEGVDAGKLVAQVKMELHYAKNNYFIEEKQILNQCGTLTDIPAVIIHGRQDLVCPLEAGWSLAQALPEADFKVLPAAGHIAQGEAMVDALVTAMDGLASGLNKLKGENNVLEQLTKKRIIIAMTGATGAVYGYRMLAILKEMESIETHLVISDAGVLNIKHELDLKRKELYALADVGHDINDIAACVASGAFKTEAMIIAPCSMKTLAAIAHGFGDNLISRAADVSLKERRRLVVVPRETPLNLAHIRNMGLVTEMGGIIFPPLPAFYGKAKTLAQLIDESVGRILETAGIETEGLYQPWEGLS